MSKILLNGLRAGGVVLEDGSEVYSNVVLSNATPKVTFLDLMPKVKYILQSHDSHVISAHVCSLLL